MSEEFIKDNDYTLSMSEVFETKFDYGKSRSSIVRTFNFLAAQVTAVARDKIYEKAGYERPGYAAVSTQMIIQNFSDIDSKEEIKLMHEKLIELGGNPPELSGVIIKKPASRSVSLG